LIHFACLFDRQNITVSLSKKCDLSKKLSSLNMDYNGLTPIEIAKKLKFDNIVTILTKVISEKQVQAPTSVQTSKQTQSQAPKVPVQTPSPVPGPQPEPDELTLLLIELDLLQCKPYLEKYGIKGIKHLQYMSDDDWKGIELKPFEKKMICDKLISKVPTQVKSPTPLQASTPLKAPISPPSISGL
jgi:hypothetical protein